MIHKQLRAAVRDAIANNRRLDAAIQQSVTRHLADRDAIHQRQMNDHPTTRRERARRDAARRISRQRRRQRDLEQLARRWRASLVKEGGCFHPQAFRPADRL